jgi:lysyl-tRNA synthetase class 2
MAVLHQRAAALAAVRVFFAARGVLEVETPLIVRHAVTEPQLANVRCTLALRPGTTFFLHTSPEYHMKRLLAAGAPDIYQVCRAFRDGESGRRHLPEFTLVEWYRRGLTFASMIAETCELVTEVARTLGRRLGPPLRLSYREAFAGATGIDPITASPEALRERALRLLPERAGTGLAASLGERPEGWLDLLMVEVVEPALRDRGLVALERFPASQSSLARLDPADPLVAERFEVYLDGLELANGFHELADAQEQRRRFAHDREERHRLGCADVEPDEALLAALASGLPDCCGVALGFDRLLMACLGIGEVGSVVTFRVPEDD